MGQQLRALAVLAQDWVCSQHLHGGSQTSAASGVQRPLLNSESTHTYMQEKHSSK